MVVVFYKQLFCGNGRKNSGKDLVSFPKSFEKLNNSVETVSRLFQREHLSGMFQSYEGIFISMRVIFASFKQYSLKNKYQMFGAHGLVSSCQVIKQRTHGATSSCDFASSLGTVIGQAVTKPVLACPFCLFVIPIWQEVLECKGYFWPGLVPLISTLHRLFVLPSWFPLANLRLDRENL